MRDIEADIGALLGQLDSWRHLPAYRLESRADAFFALFMRDVISNHVGLPLSQVVIPEFPLRRGTLYGEATTHANASVKVDYALFSADIRHVYFVELKTDQGSRRSTQDDYLRLAAEVGFEDILAGVVLSAKATESKSLPKYAHLLHRLQSLGFLSVPESFYKAACPSPRRGVRGKLGAVKIQAETGSPDIRVIYVQPNDGGPDVVGFTQFADSIEGTGAVGALFASYLRKWRSPAGSDAPGGRV